ncbi:hypothetical protein Tco_0441958 [Tanacetum coccineum]
MNHFVQGSRAGTSQCIPTFKGSQSGTSQCIPTFKGSGAGTSQCIPTFKGTNFSEREVLQNNASMMRGSTLPLHLFKIRYNGPLEATEEDSDIDKSVSEKPFQQPKQKDPIPEEENPAKITKDKQPVVNDDKPGEWYYKMEAEKQKQWKLESEREARLKVYRKCFEDHWKKVSAIRKLEEDYVYEPEPEYGNEDNCYECFDYDDLHLAYPAEKSPKWNL